MKKCLTVFVLLCLDWLPGFSQADYIFLEEFNNNKNGWWIGDAEAARAKINTGKYVIENKRTSGNYFFWLEFPVNDKEDFSIEVKLRQVSGPDGTEFGISWGASEWSNSKNFTITASGIYTIWGYNKGEYYQWQSAPGSGNINTGNEYNILSIQKSANTLKYFLNGNSVFLHDYERISGNLFGFSVGNNSKIEVEYIKVKYPKPVINLVKDVNVNQKKKNLGNRINSVYSEIAPIISPDGLTLYIAKQGDPNNTGNEKNYDIWYSERKSDGNWGNMKKMEKPLNNDGDNIVIAVSPDNNSLLLEGVYTSDGSFLSDQGISRTYRTASGWTIPRQVVIQEFYNKNEFESYCPTVDGKILIMSVERDDTYGLKDLYVSFLLPNGDYSQPFNMGSDLNTYMNEGTPFIAPDNKTLYFYSYGHPGYGSADIFMTKRLDNSWRKWSKPQNLGSAINSSDWDTYYSIAAKGDYAYLVSSRNSLGNEDIFEIKLTEESRPEPVVLVYGRVFDNKTKKPLGSSIVYEDLKSGIKAGDARSNPGNGAYKIILPYGQAYSFRAEAENYMAVSEQIDLTQISAYKEIKRDLYLVPIETGATVNLKNVQFKRSSAEFEESSLPEMDRLVALMKKYPKMEIELSGHTDTRGDKQLLLQLSELRVAAVKNYMVQKGIEKYRISGKGYGGSKPLGTGSEEIEIKNRRVEFMIKKV
ncbi:MAG: OmpA family protein [Bacteroidales bacterium]